MALPVFTANNVDFIKYAAKDGYDVTPILRKSVMITTTTGKTLQKGIWKDQVRITIHEGLDSSIIDSLILAVAPQTTGADKQVTVNYTTNTTTGYVLRQNVPFLFKGRTNPIKTVRGGVTYYGSVTFTFEEV